jgi:hypothetical protein
VPKTPKSGAGLERNQVPLSAEITCRFRPKSGAGLLRFLQAGPRSEEVGFAHDSALEGGGFELVWGFSCQVVVFGFVAGSLFGAERPFFVPSPTIRFAERAEGVKGPKR